VRHVANPSQNRKSTPQVETVSSPIPQKSVVVPQKPYWEQQTFNGHVTFSVAAYGPHSASAPQLLVQLPEPQNLR
jgi:hypothetical protein